MAGLVTKATQDSLLAIRTQLQEYRVAVAAKKLTPRHPVVDHSLGRLTLAQGIVKQARIASAPAKPATKKAAVSTTAPDA